MPTSPLPSSTNSAGLKWPPVPEARNGNSKEETAVLGACGCENEKSIKQVLLRNEQRLCDITTENECYENTKKLRVNLNCGKRKTDENTTCAELSPFLESERFSLHSGNSTNSDCKVYFEDANIKKHNDVQLSVTPTGRCLHCAGTQTNHSSDNSTGIQIYEPSNREQFDNESNRKKDKTLINPCCKLILKILVIVMFGVLLITVASLVTLHLVSKKPKNTQSGETPKEISIGSTVRNYPYETGRDGTWIPYINPDMEIHAARLSGIYMDLDTASLKEDGLMLKWQNSSNGKMSLLNHGVNYENDRFIITKPGWYIVYSKLYLVTYRHFDKHGNFTMKLFNYQHCVTMETVDRQEPKDSFCSKGSVWSGWKGSSQIWKPVLLKTGTSLEVIMTNKDIICDDKVSSSFEMISLAGKRGNHSKMSSNKV